MNCLTTFSVILAITQVVHGNPQTESQDTPNSFIQSDSQSPTSISIPLPVQSLSDSTSTPSPNITPNAAPLNTIPPTRASAPLPPSYYPPTMPFYPGMPYTPPGPFFPYPYAGNPFIGYPPYGMLPNSMNYPQYQYSPQSIYQPPLTNLSRPEPQFQNPTPDPLTPTIMSSAGESGSDINSLPPQVKEFMDMIPQILSMHEKEEQPTFPRPSYGLHKRPKAVPFFKRKPLYSQYPVYNKYPNNYYQY